MLDIKLKNMDNTLSFCLCPDASRYEKEEDVGL